MTMRAPLSRLSDDMETLFDLGAIGRLSDAELLGRFIQRETDDDAQAAFSALVVRHGPMVLGACRRVLGDEHAAADACQSVFLVLAQKARAVNVGDSLAPWLHGVSIKVARRARAALWTERARLRSFAGQDPVDRADPTAACQRHELREVVDEEIARLPHHYRSAVVYCLLEGLTQEQAARRLRCPVGTVESRLHRARATLRTNLTRRGVSPQAAILTAPTRAFWQTDLPPQLVATTAAAAVRLLASGTRATAILPAAVALLTTQTLRSFAIARLTWAAMSLLAIGLPAACLLALAVGRGAATQPRAQGVTPGTPEQPTRPQMPQRSMADRLAEILAEYQAKQTELYRAVEKASNQRDMRKIYAAMSPDEVAFTRRMIDLAATDPTDPAARDALVWVINKPGWRDHGAYGDNFARAAALLVRHRGDDPEAVRVGLQIDNVVSFHRDALVLGFYAAAKSREAKGLARMALAQYLEMKARFSAGLRESVGRQKMKVIGVIDDNGDVVDQDYEQNDEEYAYVVHARQCDPDILRAESERLYNEVIADYSDIPYVTVHLRELDALLKDPAASWAGKPLTDGDRLRLRGQLARKVTLGEIATARLDSMHNLVAGKPAPDIDGLDLDGKHLKLADYRGKVVALVFWGSWCGPCMREVPRERALALRLKDKPFALLGVNCDEDKKAALDAVAFEKMTWPNWHDGAPGTGPISRRYHVRSYPTVLLIDHRGIIREPQILGEAIDKAVDALIKEVDAKTP